MTTTTTATPHQTGNPATTAQIDYLTRLAAERGLDLNLLPDFPNLTKSRASWAIETVLRHPRLPQQQARPVAEAAKPGYYRRGDDVYKVVENADQTATYAKVLTVHEHGRATWEYAPGVGKTLAGLEPLTVEEAARLGHQHGVCMVCGRTLTNPASVEAGIGPVCAKRL